MCSIYSSLRYHWYKQQSENEEILTKSECVTVLIERTIPLCPNFDFFKRVFFFLVWTIFKILNLFQYCFCFMILFFGRQACRILAP